LKSKNNSKIKSHQELGKKFLQEYWLITPGEVRKLIVVAQVILVKNVIWMVMVSSVGQ